MSPTLSVSPLTGQLSLKRSSSMDAVGMPSLPAAPVLGARAFSVGTVRNADSNHAAMEAEAYNLLNKLCSGQAPVNDVQYAVARAVQLWIQFTTTPVYQTMKAMYKYKYHCVIVFYHAANGLHVDGHCVIRQVLSLRKHLPVVTELHCIGVDSKKHQKANKQFNRCIQTLQPAHYVG
jgi:hypothetical protein